MGTFRFTQNQLVSVWMTTTFDVEANSIEEAKAFVEQHKSESFQDLCYDDEYVGKVDLVDNDFTCDEVNFMTKEESGGKPINEIYDEHSKLLFSE